MAEARRHPVFVLAHGIVLGCALLILLPTVAWAEGCSNEAFRTGPSAKLPDCRAYELVTPAYKNGGLFGPLDKGVAADGTATLTLQSLASIDGIEDNQGDGGELYETERSSTGWLTTPMVLPASQYETMIPADHLNPVLYLMSLDGSTAVWFARAKTQPPQEVDLVTRANTGAITDIGPITPPGNPAGKELYNEALDGEQGQVVGASNDLSHILFTITANTAAGYKYWPFDETEATAAGFQGHPSLYEYVGTNNTTPMLVGVDNEGKLISRCGTAVGAPTEKEVHNAISGDGATVYFTVSPCSGGPSVDELYARIDNGEPDAHTVAISEPSSADCPACDTGGAREPAYFQGASEDGSTVFFTTTQPLLGGDASENIYEYDFDPPAGQPTVVRVSGGDSTVFNPTAEVEGVVQTSEDGSHVYFVAKGVLTTNPNSQGQTAQSGANNLYVFERDAQYPAGRTAFIADLSSQDSQMWGEENEHRRPADTTPNGRFLVMTSWAHLTPDDTNPGPQVFEYDAQTGALVRVSIGENGYNDNGNNATENTEIVSPKYQNVASEQQYWSGLTVSADGSYVFFESTGGLTPQALNNASVPGSIFSGYQVTTANNVYEYHDGQVYLISDGQYVGTFAGLEGTDASGQDVFFSTGDQLVSQDIDTNADIYDARIGGGFPPAVPPPECSGDGCQGQLSAAPTQISPGSEFQAGGNPSLGTSSVAAAKSKKMTKKKKRSKSKSRKTKRRPQSKAGRRGHASGKAGRS